MENKTTNVQVTEEEGIKTVRLRTVDKTTHPWKYKTVKKAEAGDHIEPHTRNCDYEDEALKYFEILRK